MKNLKVSAKLLFSFIIVIALCVVVGGVGIIGMGQINGSMDNMYNNQTLPLEDLINSVEYIQRLRVLLRNAVIFTGDAEQIALAKADVQSGSESFLDHMDKYGKTISNPLARQLFDDTINLFDSKFVPGLNAIIAEAENGTDQLELVSLMSELSPTTDSVRDNTLELMRIKMSDAEDANAASGVLYNTLLVVIIIAIAITVVVSILLALYISNLLSKPLLLLSSFMKKAGSTGDISLTPQDVEVVEKFSNVSDEIGQTISGSVSFVNHVTKIAKELEFIAGGDLSRDASLLSDSDVMGKSLLQVLDNLNSMFSDIQISTDQVSSGAKQIADGAQSLAQGSTEQASAVEQLSASISEIAEKTRQNANIAREASELSTEIRISAETGNSQMDQMMQAVRDINEASGQISKVIKVIDDIAFQTNILALNAAVEAARAGQHGKGFAVVAEEVRNLAAKSAEAAKDTGGLIEASIEKADLGLDIATKTSASLKQIVEGINRSADIVTQIAQSSEEQSTGIAQINVGIDQVAQVVQQNSATAEQSAAASEEMSSQSSLLKELSSQFRLKDGGIESGSGRRLMKPQSAQYKIVEHTNIMPLEREEKFGKY